MAREKASHFDKENNKKTMYAGTAAGFNSRYSMLEQDYYRTSRTEIALPKFANTLLDLKMQLYSTPTYDIHRFNRRSRIMVIDNLILPWDERMILRITFDPVRIGPL
jgi:hypothetical protein